MAALHWNSAAATTTQGFQSLGGQELGSNCWSAAWLPLSWVSPTVFVQKLCSRVVICELFQDLEIRQAKAFPPGGQTTAPWWLTACHFHLSSRMGQQFYSLVLCFSLLFTRALCWYCTGIGNKWLFLSSKSKPWFDRACSLCNCKPNGHIFCIGHRGLQVLHSLLLFFFPTMEAGY